MWLWLKDLMLRLQGKRPEDDYGQRLIDGFGLEN